MKSNKLKAFTVFLACLVFTIMALGIVSCDIGAGLAPRVNVVFDYGEGGGTPPSRITVALESYTTLPDQENMTHPAGKVLSGWKATDDPFIYNPRTDYKVSREVRLMAQWRVTSATRYTVNFSTGDGGGVAPSAIQATPGNIITLPTQENMSPPSGKAFNGWETNGILYQPRAVYTVNINNVIFTAQWKVGGSSTPNTPNTPSTPNTPNTPSTPSTTYTVTYDANGGSGTAPSAQTANAGSSVTLPSGSGLSRSGYTFGGWNTNSSGTGTNYSAGSSYTVNGNATLYAKWVGNNTPTYTVTFNINGGSGTAPSAQTANDGSSITLPSGSGLSRSGSTFGGWNTNASGTGTNYAAGSSYTVTGNVTLYARWDSNTTTPTVTTYTVTFDINGGSGTAPSAQAANAGSSVTLPSGSGLTRSGYTFGGWNTNASGTGTNYSAGSSYMVNGNATLYAKWDSSPTTPSVTTYTVTFNANGGSGTAPSAQTANAGGSITLPSGSGLSNSSYTFGGWNTNAAGTGTTYSAGSSYTVTGNVTLYARWASVGETIIIYFNSNGGGGTAPSSQRVAPGTSITLPSGDGLSRNGFTFGGWNTNYSGTGTTYPAGSSFTPTGTGTINLYAKWDPITYTVTFNINGGSGTPPPAQTVNSGVHITFPSGSGLSRSGYVFGGWNTNASGTGTTYSAGSSIWPTGNVTFYAKWDTSGTTYTVTFSANGGSGTAPSAQTVNSGGSITLPSGDGLSRSGYYFAGWTINANNIGGTYYPAGSSYTVSGNITLYAIWYSTTCTVTYNTNGGSGTTPSAQTVSRGSSITLPSGSGLSRDGYSFGGWGEGIASGTNYPAGSSYTVLGNITFYARWNLIVMYTVNFIANGGSGTAPSVQTVNGGSSITLPSGSGLSRPGYTFGGWNTNAAGTGTTYAAGSSYTPTNSTNFYAKWNPL